MLKKLTLFSLTLLFYLNVNAQNFDVRRLTLKSDVILFYDQDSLKYIDDLINDYTSEHFYQLKAVDTIVKNMVGFKFANTKLRYILEGEDYFKIVEKGIDCISHGKAVDMVKRKYYGMLFLKKTGKQFNVIGIIVNDNSLPVWQSLIQQIKTVADLDKVKNLPERYTKSIDWFLANNILPDENFLKFYKLKGVLKTDTAVLTKEQQALAKRKFFNGNEIFLDFIGKAYPNEVKEFYLQVLKDIVFQSEYEFGDCVRFQRITDMLTNNFNDNYDDINNKLNELLTNQLEHYEKEPLMQQMIKVIEEGKYKVGSLTSDRL